LGIGSYVSVVIPSRGMDCQANVTKELKPGNFPLRHQKITDIYDQLCSGKLGKASWDLKDV
jgi:hypothetical protein